MPSQEVIQTMIQKARIGDKRCIARVLSWVESGEEDLIRSVLEALYQYSGKAQILGITGPPGAGKSTLTDQWVEHLRQRKQRVAVVAVDPSSPFSGGAILGDRIRMGQHIFHDDVYIRSLGTRGYQGGLSRSTRDVVTVLDALGFDWILVETAGVGQTELDIMKLAHAVCVVLVPESGDGIQMMKAGLMEIADLFIVNKSDRPEAEQLVREILNSLQISSDLEREHEQAHHGAGAGSSIQNSSSTSTRWIPPVIKTQAFRGLGLDELVVKTDDFFKYLRSTGQFDQRQTRLLSEELRSLCLGSFESIYCKYMNSSSGQDLLQGLKNRSLTPYSARDELMKQLMGRR